MPASGGAGPGALSPAASPPPVAESEFVRVPAASGEQAIDAGIVIVGAGPAGLACAIELTRLLEGTPELAAALGELPVAVVEKSRLAGGHQLSGAVLDPVVLGELLPAEPEGAWPHWGRVERDFARLLVSARRSIRLRPVPPPFRNRGLYVVSLAELTRWLAERAQAAGAALLLETVGRELLARDGAVAGVRTGARGLRADGTPGPGHDPGTEIRARATVLAEGVAGHLASAAIAELGLRGGEPQAYALGVKELWELERPFPGAAHTLGWPLRPQRRLREVGGAWLYGMNRPGEPPMASLGFVAGLGHADAQLSVHDLLQELKRHPLIASVLRGGRRIGWGAKAIPEGGWWSMPRPHARGLVLCGDSAGLVDVPRLKGIHHAMRSGVLAARAIHAALLAGSDDFSAYAAALRDSPTGADLRSSRNARQALELGLPAGLAVAGAMTLTRGRLPGGRWRVRPDAEVPLLSTGRAAGYPAADGRTVFDKESSVWLTGLQVRDGAPDHLRVSRRVPRRVAEAWRWMCPAGVYDLPDAPAGADPGELVTLRVQPANCVQCGAISAKGGRLTPPEGGVGPAHRLG